LSSSVKGKLHKLNSASLNKSCKKKSARRSNAEYRQSYALAVRSYEGIILWNNHLRPAHHPIHSTARSVPGSHKELTRSSILKMRRLLLCPHELQRLSR